jgi:alpha-tubulin suppressor-like RCC1 family protein
MAGEMFGQLGIGPNPPSNQGTPMRTHFNGSFSSISTGSDTSVGLDSEQKLWSWGWRGSGALGIVGSTNLFVPTLINFPWNGGNVTKFSTGTGHTIAISNNGTFNSVYCWGANNAGQLALGDTTNRLVPVEITFPFSGNVISILAGNQLSFYITDTGLVYANGANDAGALSTGDLLPRNLPTLVNITWDGTPTNVVVGIGHAIILTNSGSAYSVGYNAYGQLGTGNTLSRSLAEKFSNSSVTIFGTDTHFRTWLTVSCPDGAHDPNCEFRACFSLYSSDSSVCGGVDSCIAADTCTCPANRYKPDCTGSRCYGFK